MGRRPGQPNKSKEPTAEQLLQRHAWMTDPQGVLLWAVAHQLRTETGDPMEWHNHRFMVDIFCDMSPEQVFMKCSQVGATSLELFKAYFLAQVLGRRIIYSLPREGLVEDLSTTKLEPLEKNNPRIVPTVVNNKSSKSWPKGYILFRGTMGDSQDVMVTADYIIADEVNHSDISVVKGLQSRLSASTIQAQWWFGHPTFPGKGVDEKWRESDKREWHVTCKGCGEEQPLDFWTNIDRVAKAYVCRTCRHVITDEDRRTGRWLATVTEVDGEPPRWRGYHISHLIAPWISAAKVLEAEKETKEHFFSKVLGLPFIGGSGSVDPALIRAANIWPMPEDFTPKQKFIGVDVGGPLHVVIGNERGITKALMLGDEPGKLDSKWAALDRLMILEQPSLVVIDNAPSGKQQVAFQQRHPYKVLRAIYDYNNKRKDDWEKDSDHGTINANRTRIIDTVLESFGTGGLPVFMEPTDPFFDGPEKGTSKIENCLVQHWGTLFQVGGDGQDINLVKKDRFQNVIRTWENQGPDHFAHATVYYYLARSAGRYVGTGTGGFMPGGGGSVGKQSGPVRKDPLDEWDDEERPKLTFYGM